MQLSYTANPPRARAGMFGDAHGPRNVLSRVCRGLVQAGRFVLRVPGFGGPDAGLDNGEVYQTPSPAAGAATAALVPSTATAAAITTLTAASCTGVAGAGPLRPARKLTLTLSSHADFDATTAVITYVNELDQQVSENMVIPNGGNTTLTTTGYCQQFVSLVIPAQSGTGGAYQLGVAILDSSLTLTDIEGVAHFEPIKEVASKDVAEYGDGDQLGVQVFGSCWVIAEEAMARGDTVYVRTGAGTNTGLGAIRNDDDSSSCVAYTGAKVLDYDADTGLAKIWLPG